MPVITDAQSKILAYLKGKGFVSPTKIAESVAGPLKQSAWASPKCLNLVEQGLLKRDCKGHYALIDG